MNASLQVRSMSFHESVRSRGLVKVGAALCAAWLAGGSLGCAFGEFRPHDPLQREYSLEEMQKRYTDLIRFSNFEMAVGFVEREHRKAFIHAMPHEDDLRFLDYETDPFVLNDEMNESTIEVVYTAYSPWTLRQIEVYETQEWSRTEGMGNNWTVRSTFFGLEPYLKKRTRPNRPASAKEAAAQASAARDVAAQKSEQAARANNTLPASVSD